MLEELKTRRGKIKLPVFMPDATRGVIKAVTMDQVRSAAVRMLVTNTFHLMLRPGDETIRDLGGIHKFMNWDGPVLTDSGGFQVFSLIHKRGLGEITDEGARFKSPIDGSEHMLTPEKSIEVQLNLDSDILVVLDEPISIDSSKKKMLASVDRTTAWAKRSREYFDGQPKERTKGKKLFAVIQGGLEKDLRKKSAEELIEIGFDGYGFGGWPVDENGVLLKEILKFTADQIPDDIPKYAMGVGMPDDIKTCEELGYTMFDVVIPTRNARHGYLFLRKGNKAEKKDGYEVLRLQNSELIGNKKPVDKHCDCELCVNYSRGYISHLFRAKEPVADSLATIHNLKFYEEWVG